MAAATGETASEERAIDSALADSVRLAVACLATSRHAEARSLLAAVLDLRPQHALANYHCGLLCLADGELEAALDHLALACEADPSCGEFWIATADCLLRLLRHGEALQVLETALAAGLEDPRAEPLLQAARVGALHALPDEAAADENLHARLRVLVAKSVHQAATRRKARPAAGAELQALSNRGDWRALAEAALDSLERQPALAKEWDLLGVAYLQLGKAVAARIALVRAGELLPRDAEVWDHLAVAERLLGHLPDSAQAFRRSLALDPGRAETWVNLGNLQIDQGQRQEALVSFRRALSLSPACAEAMGSIGNVLRDQGQLAEALHCCQDFVRQRPDVAEGHCNLGNVLRDLGQVDEAIAAYRQALALKPGLAEAYSGLGRALIDRGALEEALLCYERALQMRPDLLEVHSNLLKTVSHLGRHSPAESLALACRFGRQASQRASRPCTRWRTRDVNAPLRVGLVSGDLRQHPVGYFLENVVAQIDPASIALHAYATFDGEDALSARLRPRMAGWTSLTAMSDEAAARRIHADGIDVLLDLSGHTAHSRLPLFAWRPAPVQASWLGYFATTGLAEMDYLLADPHVAPESESDQFTETVWRLPETYLCFTPPDVALAVSPLPALENGAITFACFNNLTKLNDEVLTVWAQVLQALPDARLLLKTALLDDASARTTIQRRFAQRGIDAERLLLEGRSPRVDLLATYQRVDIALDPFPYPGGTTSVEALWMGVPVVTRRGDRFLGHVGETVLHNAGLADWIARDNDDYVALAVARAGDRQALAALRAALRARVLTAPIFDAARFARHFEAALHGMWADKLSRQGGGA